MFIYFLSNFSFHDNLFSATIYFEPKSIFGQNLFSANIYFQPKYVLNKNPIFPKKCDQAIAWAKLQQITHSYTVQWLLLNFEHEIPSSIKLYTSGITLLSAQRELS